MILFPLMATWVWSQVFTASMLLSSAPPVEVTCDDEISLLPDPLEGGQTCPRCISTALTRRKL
jgi:hypothetical protein